LPEKNTLKINKRDGIFFLSLLLFTVFISLSNFYSFLLFHTVAELFSVVIASAIFIIAWNSRNYIDNKYLLIIGIAFLFIGIIDFVHTMSYSGLNLITGLNQNIQMQLWIAARYLEAVTFILAPLLMFKKIGVYRQFILYAVVTAAILYSVFISGTFPACYLPWTGVTQFEIYSEFLISFMLVLALWLLYVRRESFDRKVFLFIGASLVFSLFSEFSFTFYISSYWFSNVFGLVCKIISFGLIYYAVVETGIRRPYSVIFRNLKKRENELKIERDRFDQYLDIAEAIFLVLDREGKVMLINRKGCEVLGYEKEEIRGFDWFENFMPQGDGDTMRSLFMQDIGEGMSHVKIEGHILTKSGELKTILWQNSLIRDEKSVVTASVSSGEDITEKKSIERDLRLKNVAIETSINGIVILDMKAIITYANPSFAHMYGYDSPDDVTGMSSSVFFKNSIDLDSVIDRIIKKGGYVGEMKSKKKSGEDIFVQISAYFLKPEDSTKSCIYISLVDVTERERIKEALASANMKLNILSSITRHDILNEVTVAIGYLDMINEVSPEEKEDFIKKTYTAVEGIRRQAEFTRDYQDMGLSSPLWQNTGRVAKEYLASNGGYGGIDVKIDADSVEIFADPMLPKVFANIMSNSLVHGEKVSKITIFSSKDDSGNLIITIEDNGVGISAEKKKSLFKPGIGRNHGFGLYLVKEILSITGIGISETGKEGEGAKFVITVPPDSWRGT
jgi:PAS domain S-box-containing protein